jgi:hypothetical protein
MGQVAPIVKGYSNLPAIVPRYHIDILPTPKKVSIIATAAGLSI